jgi:hypothetical protein
MKHTVPLPVLRTMSAPAAGAFTAAEDETPTGG